MPLLTRLKLETASEHHHIEGVVPLMRPGFTLPQYAAYLGRLYRFQHTIEDALERWAKRLPPEFEFEKRLKAPRLADDLRALGVRPDASPAPVPSLEDLDQAWGCLYVLEGSTLGGQVISRHLAQTLGITPRTGGSFLWAYGEETGAMWRHFKTCLLGSSLGNEASVIEGARSTFRSLADWLRDPA